MTKNAPSEALVEAMARAIYNDGRGPRVTPFDQLAKGAKHYWYGRAQAAAAVIADALAERDREIEAQGNYLDDIKQEALTAGAPGQRSTAKALAHIVKLCNDARAALGSAEG